MSYKAIKGKFIVKGFSPDGDSIRFVADDKQNQKWFKWGKGTNKTKATNNKEIKMQLRMEAIDALETHYNYKYHQPRSFGIAGMDTLLQLLGIEVYKYSIDYTKIVEADDGKDGYIISSGLDMYDRPVSFLFSGKSEMKDGEELKSLSEQFIKKSLNYSLLDRGIVYPTFYSGIDSKILEVFRKTTKKARKEKRGIWAIDKTPEFTFWETFTIQDDVVILPKLFRRLATFIDEYSEYNQLQLYFKKSKDPVRLLNSNVDKDFSEILEIEGRNIRLKEFPEDLLFIPK